MAAAVGVGAALGPTGCSHTLTEEDCTEVRERIEKVWTDDANEAATHAENEQVRRFVKDEAGRIGEAWMTRCRARVGSEIDSKELACLKSVDHIDDVSSCEAR